MYYVGTISTVPEINEVGMFSLTFDLLSGGEIFPTGIFGPNGRHWINNLRKGNLIIADARRVYGDKTGRVCLVVRNVMLSLSDALGKNINLVT
jgi:hypothetical protein